VHRRRQGHAGGPQGQAGGRARRRADNEAFAVVLDLGLGQRIQIGDDLRPGGGAAGTQNNLGTALSTLGERERGTARLEEALAAFREALKEWTRERVPLQWAMAQNNLGTALSDLGERESGTARLEEAVAAYRDALKEFTRERVPLDWAITQNNLGDALTTLGERESGTARLEEAVAAYRDALQEWTRENAPHYQDTAQKNLDRTLKLVEERTAKKPVAAQPK
jgi:tetratricopeptide (TPR) repeat protein